MAIRDSSEGSTGNGQQMRLSQPADAPVSERHQTHFEWIHKHKNITVAILPSLQQSPTYENIAIFQYHLYNCIIYRMFMRIDPIMFTVADSKLSKVIILDNIL